jgi:phosphatidylinositol kinase/protein kinase (PI-3  family)
LSNNILQYSLLKDELIASIRSAFRSKISPEIHQILLNLAEYVERVGLEWKSIGVEELGEHAKDCHAYAKALHYMEMQFLRVKLFNGGMVEPAAGSADKKEKLELAKLPAVEKVC